MQNKEIIKGWYAFSVPMITKVISNYVFIEDVSIANNTLRISTPAGFRLSASVWILPVVEGIVATRKSCLRSVTAALTVDWSKWETWVIAAHETMQANNRITRYNGFWKSLEKAGITCPTGELTSESVLEYEDGIRGFGAVRIDPSNMESAYSLFGATAAVIAFFPISTGTIAASTLVKSGWPLTRFKPPVEILETVCRHGGLVSNLFGEFDDPEVLIAIIGERDVIHRFDARL